MDITCRRCGEPYDSTEFDGCASEKSRFLRGVGCPSCEWGTRCPNCRGRGKRGDAGCVRCHGTGEVLTRVTGRPTWTECECMETAAPCARCNGTGKLPDEEHDAAFMASAMESTDDPDRLFDLWEGDCDE